MKKTKNIIAIIVVILIIAVVVMMFNGQPTRGANTFGGQHGYAYGSLTPIY
jgi:preprotein translocase subunit SecG